MASPLFSTDLSRHHHTKNNNLQKHHNPIHNPNQHNHQLIYSSKLRQAFTTLNLARNRNGKQLREAADRLLAVTAKGRTRWSRAILTNRLKLKFRKQHKRKRVVYSSTESERFKKQTRFNVLGLKGKTVPDFERKVKVLGRLVPGCRKEPLAVILEEAIDYIPALEMQVRAMTALYQLLFASSSGGAATFGPL
ncbi:unnamed protein product [Lupinus luteus]|uniref:BHLH domain-containing protein n=1 Tax=Lupinus luteus TaxID=3873 RepID=A0AAV1WK03_LUPLU